MAQHLIENGKVKVGLMLSGLCSGSWGNCLSLWGSCVLVSGPSPGGGKNESCEGHPECPFSSYS